MGPGKDTHSTLGLEQQEGCGWPVWIRQQIHGKHFFFFFFFPFSFFFFLFSVFFFFFFSFFFFFLFSFLFFLFSLFLFFFFLFSFFFFFFVLFFSFIFFSGGENLILAWENMCSAFGGPTHPLCLYVALCRFSARKPEAV